MVMVEMVVGVVVVVAILLLKMCIVRLLLQPASLPSQQIQFSLAPRYTCIHCHTIPARYKIQGYKSGKRYIRYKKTNIL